MMRQAKTLRAISAKAAFATSGTAPALYASGATSYSRCEASAQYQLQQPEGGAATRIAGRGTTVRTFATDPKGDIAT